MKKFFFCLFVLLVLGGLWLWNEASVFLASAPEQKGQEVLIDILPGSSLHKVAQSLETKGVVTSAKKFQLLARWRDVGNKIQAGRFAFRTDWIPDRVLQEVLHGKPVFVRVTIPEGYTWWQTAALLDASGMVKAADFIQVITDPSFLKHHGIPFANAEGFLMPDTYLFPSLREDQVLDLARAKNIANRLVDNFWRKAGTLWKEDGRPHEDTLKKAVILASIVEKESSVGGERPRIAGVYENRLRKNMLLQADPTVIYGIGEKFNGNITKANLADSSNSYNTYKHIGLPPGPICSFGISALQASLHPEQHDYLFFVAITDRGSHSFSRTLAEHNEAVRRYLQNRRHKTQ